MITFIGYPKCSTCKRAEEYLKHNNIKYEYKNIKLDNPSEKDLREYIKLSNKDIKAFFNTSGLIYKELNLKEKLLDMTDDDKIKLLSSNGMLVKRPILVLENKVLVGFNENKWNEIIK